MPTIKVTLLVDVDDVPVAGFPLVRRIEFPETQSLVAIRATGGGFVNLPSGELTTIQAAILTSDQTVSFAFNGATTNPIVMSPNGLLITFDTSQSGAISVSNASGSSATIRGLIAGA